MYLIRAARVPFQIGDVTYCSDSIAWGSLRRHIRHRGVQATIACHQTSRTFAWRRCTTSLLCSSIHLISFPLSRSVEFQLLRCLAGRFSRYETSWLYISRIPLDAALCMSKCVFTEDSVLRTSSTWAMHSSNMSARCRLSTRCPVGTRVAQARSSASAFRISLLRLNAACSNPV